MKAGIAKTKATELATSSAKRFSEILAQYSEAVAKARDLPIAVNADTPAIGLIATETGQISVISWVAGHIVGLAGFLNLGASISESQTRETAALIVEEFGNLTLSDVALIFRRAKLGAWGEFYGRLDGQMILSWCRKYFDERCEYCAQKSAYEGDKHKGRDFQLPSKGDGARLQKEILTLVKNCEKLKNE
jgi:hypothetical protein